MDYIRDHLSTVLHLPVLLPCFAVFPVRFCVSRLAIAHTDAIRAKFYWRKRITFFSKNTFNPICLTQAKETFSCSLDSKFPLVSQGGACSRTNWPIQPELIPVPLGWKGKENYIPHPLKMSKKRTFLIWKPISKAIFQKLQNSKSGKWKMDLSCNTISFTLKIEWQALFLTRC